VDLDPSLQGARAVELLADVLSDKNPEKKVLLQPTLAIRDSCHRPAHLRSERKDS
jgi:DNA-binding LacI/PurR family transcriptional regulator